MKYYAPSTRGFYDPNEHGPRMRAVPDPSWVRPTADLVLRPGESVTDATGATLTNETGAEQTAAAVPDWSAEPPVVYEPNPDTQIPADAVEISDEEHLRLLREEARGLVIQPDRFGVPQAVPRTYTMQEMRDAVFPELRRVREVALNRLSGIGMRAMLAGDGDTAQTCADLQLRLLDVTNSREVLAVTEEDGPDALRAAALAAIGAISNDVPPALRPAFADISPELVP